MDDKPSLDDQVDQFYQDIRPPPGFVIRLYPDEKWTVKYEANGLSRDKAARIVEAIRRALE